MRPNHPKNKPKISQTHSPTRLLFSILFGWLNQMTEVGTGLGLINLGLAKGVWTRAFVSLCHVAGGIQYI